MNFSAVPDFVAIGGVIAVFWTLLRRTRQSRLNFWLVGWLLLLVHIIAQFVAQNTAGSADGAYSVAVAMLVLIANSFIWASNDQLDIHWRNLSIVGLSAIPDVALLTCDMYGIRAPWLYGALTVMGAGSTLWMMRAWHGSTEQPSLRWRTSLVLAAYSVQGALLAFKQPDEAITWMLAWHYLAVAAFYRMTAPRPSASVRFTTINFIAWGLVFPAADLMAVLWPHAHVDAEVWNLPKFLVATGMTFTLLEEQLSKAEYASLHDELTGLPNRRMLARRLRASMDRAKAMGRLVALVVIDLDGFKEINDTLGHAAGDEVLRWAARQFRTQLGERDVLARLGGDEFAVVLREIPDRGAAQLAAQNLRHALEGGMVILGRQLAIRASVGFSMFPDESDDADRLYAIADRAMYDRKPGRREQDLPSDANDLLLSRADPQACAGRKTRSVSRVVEPRIHASSEQSQSLLSELTAALEQDQFELVFQPKLDLKSGRCVSAEALVRWRHPQRGLLLPGAFIPFAEQTGFVVGLTRWVVGRACAQHANWRSAGLVLPLSVNVSVRDLEVAGFPVFVTAQLQRHGVAPGCFCLEITEGAVIANVSQACKALEKLRRMGVHLSIDDYGTGYASLAHLRALPVREIKIDQSFVRGLASNAGDEIIVRSTIELAHNLGLEVVAEGLESEAALAQLVLLGCDEAQGYYLSSPLSADDFVLWCKDRLSRGDAARAISESAHDPQAQGDGIAG
ncbi:MAG: putative bifunctional diguanylate cyclase/phosphodiesterase [Steroidobacteraceae bacterium]